MNMAITNFYLFYPKGLARPRIKMKQTINKQQENESKQIIIVASNDFCKSRIICSYSHSFNQGERRQDSLEDIIYVVQAPQVGQFFFFSLSRCTSSGVQEIEGKIIKVIIQEKGKNKKNLALIQAAYTNIYLQMSKHFYLQKMQRTR